MTTTKTTTTQTANTQTLYLSKLELNLRSHHTRRDLNNPYEMHRTLSNAVSAGLDAGLERLLWRTEQHRFGVTVLVQTHTEPNWRVVMDKYDGYFTDLPQHKPFAPQLGRGQRLRFRLRGNPTVKRQGKRYGLYKTDEQLDWLSRKLTAAGAVLESALLQNDDLVKPKSDKHAMKVLAVTFDGYLFVDDADSLARAIAEGIGSAKGLGMGLLSIGRASGT